MFKEKTNSRKILTKIPQNTRCLSEHQPYILPFLHFIFYFIILPPSTRTQRARYRSPSYSTIAHKATIRINIKQNMFHNNHKNNTQTSGSGKTRKSRCRQYTREHPDCCCCWYSKRWRRRNLIARPRTPSIQARLRQKLHFKYIVFGIDCNVTEIHEPNRTY